jgi:hypothetical protein
MLNKILLTNLFAGAMALTPIAALADCVSIEPLLQREARLESHVERGQEHGYLSQNEGQKFKRKLERLRETLSWYKSHHCMSVSDGRQLNDELTRVSVQIFRALHRGESRIVSL